MLFRIRWEDAWLHYLMNGAFDYEQEILLYDGAPFEVLSVIDEEFQVYQIDFEGLKYHG